MVIIITVMMHIIMVINDDEEEVEDSYVSYQSMLEMCSRCTIARIQLPVETSHDDAQGSVAREHRSSI